MSQQHVNDLLLQQYRWVSIEPLKETKWKYRGTYEQYVTIRTGLLMEVPCFLYYDENMNLVEYGLID